jgi:hypothetical protein
LRARDKPPLPLDDGKRAGEGDDERAMGGPVLQLLEKDEEQGLEPLDLIEPTVSSVSVDVLLTDPERDGPD